MRGSESTQGAMFCFAALVLLSSAVEAREGAVAGTVRDARGSPVASVTIMAVGTDVVTVTERDGGYRLNLAVRSHRVIAAAAGFAEAQQRIAVTAGETTKADFTLRRGRSQFAEEVVVTGSRIKRADIEGPAPVQILTGEQIKGEGFVTVYDALTTLNEAIGTVEADLQWGTHTPNASPINLRNMGPNRGLLLVNGRRVADYPLPYQGQSNFANYGNIPAAAVDRIEILSGSASAIYGSDAVAGVINVILKQDWEGDEARVRGGSSTEGGRDTGDLSWAGGRSGAQWNLTYALQWTRRDPLFGRDRPSMDDADDAPAPSWNAEQRKLGFRPFTGLGLFDVDNDFYRIRPPEGTCEKFRGEYSLYHRQLYDRNNDAVIDTGWLCGLAADFADWLLMSGSEDLAGYLHGTWAFDNGILVWSNFAYYDAEGIWSTSPPAAVTAEDAGGIFFDAASGRPLQGIRQFTAAEVGGLDGLRNTSEEVSWDLSAGLRGTILGDRFTWDAALGRARYGVEERISTVDFVRANEFFLGPQLGTTPDGLPIYQLNEERWWNPVTPEEYGQFGIESVNNAESWVHQASFSLTGALLDGWAGPIGFAAIAEAARQGYDLDPDPGANVTHSVQNVDRGGGERTRYSLGAELRVPLLASVTATVAGRYDRYGDYEATDHEGQLDVGSQSETTYNFGLQWRPVSRLLLRGTYATSFHAPDLHFLMGQPSAASVTRIDPLRCIRSDDYLTGSCGQGTPHTYLFASNRRGTPDLRSELGDSWTTGFVWDVTDTLSLTADSWSITLDDEIRDVDTDTILRDEAGCLTGLTIDAGIPWSNPGGAEYCGTIVSRVVRDAQGRIVAVERGPINIAEKEVAGIDTSLRYLFDTVRWGDFTLALNYTNLLSLRERTFRTDPNPNLRDRNIRSKLRGSIGWVGERWNWTVYGDRIGSVPGVHFRFDPNRGVVGGCRPFDDGHIPSDDPRFDCQDRDPASPTFGQKTSRYYGRVGPAITWNFNVGYRVLQDLKLNLYVNNVLNSTGWNHKDPYKRDYEFYNSRLFTPVGRELALELVYTLD